MYRPKLFLRIESPTASESIASGAITQTDADRLLAEAQKHLEEVFAAYYAMRYDFVIVQSKPWHEPKS
ncbi:hypothetical protein VSR68_03325 [Paraburkholderia phymatum]|uniref:hypothetical protein n=1 Tax=Paraburkholderia phymatum TaxID=148447 RepID=UPI0031730CAF